MLGNKFKIWVADRNNTHITIVMLVEIPDLYFIEIVKDRPKDIENKAKYLQMWVIHVRNRVHTI